MHKDLNLAERRTGSTSRNMFLPWEWVPTMAKDAFGDGNGLSHQFGLAMHDEGVTPSMFQAAVALGSLRKRSVGAALRGDLTVEQAALDEIVTRENNTVQLICGWAGVAYPGTDVIREALQRAQSQWGEVTGHDRFVPAGLGLPQLFAAIYGFNEWAKSAEQVAVGRMPIPLYHEQNSEWWRKDKSVQYLPTKAGVSRLNHVTAMQPYDMTGRPYNRNYDEHVADAQAMRFDGIMEAELATYHFLRNVIEFGRPLWAAGSCRCVNTYGSAYSLSVSWDAALGFSVSSWNRENHNWNIGSLSRKYLELGC